MTTLAASSLTMAYNGRAIIERVDMVARSSEIVGLIGPNGAGKTTMLHALAGLLAPKSGQALLEDRDVRSLTSSARARAVGLVPQHEAHVWSLTVEEIVRLGRAPHRGWLLPLSVDDLSVVEEALAFTELTALRHRPVSKLSGGEHQRVMIARALAQQPEVLLLDEPTANLDIHHQVQLLNLVRQLVEDRQLAVIMAIHDLTLAARYCDRLVMLHEKNAYATGTPVQVLTAENLRAVFGVDAELYRDPRGQWALSIHAA